MSSWGIVAKEGQEGYLEIKKDISISETMSRRLNDLTSLPFFFCTTMETTGENCFEEKRKSGKKPYKSDNQLNDCLVGPYFSLALFFCFSLLAHEGGLGGNLWFGPIFARAFTDLKERETQKWERREKQGNTGALLLP